MNAEEMKPALEGLNKVTVNLTNSQIEKLRPCINAMCANDDPNKMQFIFAQVWMVDENHCKLNASHISHPYAIIIYSLLRLVGLAMLAENKIRSIVK